MNIPASQRAKRRATVVIRQRHLELDEGYPDGLAREWVHADEWDPREITFEDHGVRLRWAPRDGGGEVFVPWSSVVRIDYERCGCMECEQARAAAALPRSPS